MANKPNNPSLWSKAKSLAKQKFDVYPSAYANGWAAKWYKSKGGTWRKAMYGMEVPEMEVGGLFPRFMQEGGEPDGGMALGQMNAVIGKLMKLREFINPDSDLEPWVSSKLAVMDHYADAVHDEMMYGEVGDEGEEYEEEEEDEEEEEEEESPMTEDELEEMRNGGIPERYRKRGFTKVGVKRQSTRPGKKWMVLAKKGDQYKIVHGGYKGMKDFTQHRNKKRQKKFWTRMGGRDSAKAKDPFSPLYWHKRFGTWQDGGYVGMDGKRHKSTGSTFSGNAFYQMGGSAQQDQVNKIIQAYSEIADVSPEQIVNELRKMNPQDQQKALQQMAQAIQQTQNTGMQSSPMMKMGGVPCYKCGGSKYQDGGAMMDQYGGVFLPAMPVDIYGVPLYAQGGSTMNQAMRGYVQNPFVEDMMEMKYGGGLEAFVRNPYVEDMMEMAEGGKMPAAYARARFAAAGNLDKMDEYGYMYGGNIPEMKRGGIYINPANKGKFTAKAKKAGMGVQSFASKVLNAPEGRYSAETRRQANFARNAAKWKKQEGGNIPFNVPMELSDDEIQALIAAGYNIQYLD